MPTDIEKVKEHWGKEASAWQIGRGIHWTEHPVVACRLNLKSSGFHERDHYQHLITLLEQRGVGLPLSRCLTLGSGAGELERGLSKYQFCARHDALDISDEAVKQAIAAARQEGLTHVSYQVADLNSLELPPDAYDLVFGVSSIHHVMNLEGLFTSVHHALKPGGYFFLNEFVGPTRFQWTDRQLGAINAALQILPEKYRISLKDGRVKQSVQRPSLEDMANIDPSEAVRSADILPLLFKHFVVLEKKALGGTVLHLLLEEIAGNFDPFSVQDMRWLRLLFELEDTLLETGEIASDFCVVLCQRV